MTRTEAYAHGFHTGRLWAEADARDGVRVDPENYREGGGDLDRAHWLGQSRGYRDTWERIYAGTLTRSSMEVSR